MCAKSKLIFQYQQSYQSVYATLVHFEWRKKRTEMLVLLTNEPQRGLCGVHQGPLWAFQLWVWIPQSEHSSQSLGQPYQSMCHCKSGTKSENLVQNHPWNFEWFQEEVALVLVDTPSVWWQPPCHQGVHWSWCPLTTRRWAADAGHLSKWVSAPHSRDCWLAQTYLWWSQDWREVAVIWMLINTAQLDNNCRLGVSHSRSWVIE